MGSLVLNRDTSANAIWWKKHFGLRLADSPQGMAENDRAIAPLMDSVGQSWTHPQSHDPHDTTWGRDKSSLVTLVWLLKHFNSTQGRGWSRWSKKSAAHRAQWTFFYRFVFLLLEFVGPCLPSGLGDSTTRPTASFWVFSSFSLPQDRV